jgi:carboxyl-terminal processing protease
LSEDSIHYALSNEEYKIHWQRWLKYQVLEQLASIMSVQELDKKSVLQKEPVAREKVRTSEQRNIKRILDHAGGYENYLASMLCDVIANLYDPHTEYMPLGEKQSFEADLGTEGFYFGLSVKENDKGEIEIVRLMPGSPAWNCGELNKGDILLKLAWEGKDSFDLRGASQEEVSELLDGPVNSRMLLTVRKANGVEKTTSLVKEKIRNEDNTVRGFVLKSEKKIGYIYLPDFYTDLEGSTNASSANDVAKEIVKLKKENIDGLILDVRYNGGGSLREALDMAGIFIDEGPLCMIREKTGKVSSLKDLNRGTIYDGPLVLLINGQSASASELLGAVLQDYNRGLVVGSNTYGKGTAQVILPVDTTASKGTGGEAYGFVKVTTSKFYRVNGNTTQHSGVKPDIVLPDIFDALDYRESNSSNALPADTVKKNAFYKPLSLLPVKELATNSKARTGAHKGFIEIEKYVRQLRGIRNQPTQPLSLKWDIYIADIEKEETFEQSLHPFAQVTSNRYVVENNSFDSDKLKSDPFLAEVNAAWKKKLVKDIYIEEAFLILMDHIHLLKKTP